MGFNSGFKELIACHFSRNTVSTLARSYYRNKLEFTNLNITNCVLEYTVGKIFFSSTGSQPV